MNKVFLIIFLFLPLSLYSQVEDSIHSLPSMAEVYYQNVNALNRNFNYELAQKKRTLKTTSSAINVSSIAAFAGCMIAGSTLLSPLAIPEWLTITITAVSSVGSMTGLMFWGSNLKNKSDAIVIPSSANDTITVLELNTLLSAYAIRYGFNTANYADCLLFAANALADVHDNEQALKLMLQSDSIFALSSVGGCFGGRDTTQQMLRLDTEAKLEYNSGRDFVAIKLYKQSSILKQLYFGDDSEPYLQAILDLSSLYAERLRNGKSFAYHNAAFYPYMERLKQEFCSLSESEKSTYWNIAARYINRTLDIAHRYATPIRDDEGGDLAASAYDGLLLSKGMLLNLSIDFENYIKTSGNRKAIEHLYIRKKYANEGSEQYLLDSMDYVIMGDLKQSNQSYSIPQLSIQWEDVQQSLQPQDLAIEFYQTNLHEYGAILLRSDWKSPRIIPLKNVIKLGKKDYATLHDILLQHPFESAELNAEDTKLLWKLSQAIWVDDIMKYFPAEDDGIVYFAADGNLLVTGIEYLPFVKPYSNQDPEGRFITMSDVFHMVRLSSTRELSMHKHFNKDSSAVVYGGIFYDVDTRLMESNSLLYASANIPYTRSLNLDTFYRAGVNYLPGTRKEAETIVQNLTFHHIPTVLYDSTLGTEESFKNMHTHSPRLLHIATHGFFFPEKTAAKRKLFQTWVTRSSTIGIDPMLRSGLLLAGSNLTFTGHGNQLPNGVQDGILTSKEISLLDLNNTELVVLSACQTGLGDVTSDGVFGLQRAFKQAGAQSIIMSLWPVNDAATQLFMTEFYYRWTNGVARNEAFNQARQKVRLMYPDPAYWAAFILLD